jgi:hypothetical protein
MGRPSKARGKSSAKSGSAKRPRLVEGPIEWEIPLPVEDELEARIAAAVPAAIVSVIPQIAAQVASHLSSQSPQPIQEEVVSPVAQCQMDVPLLETVQHHVSTLTGRRSFEPQESDEEDDTLTYTLSDKEVLQVEAQEYLDFSAVYRRHLKAPFDFSKPEELSKQVRSEAIPVIEWVRIFCAFQSEHVRFFPKDAPHMPKYVDLILKMSTSYMQWLQYDFTFRTRRAKKALRNPKKVKGWGQTDIELYIACNSRVLPKPLKPSKPGPSEVSHQGPDMPKGTCWKFQGVGCDGACLWPDTHKCYKCSGPHPTKSCRGEGSQVTQSSDKEFFHGHSRERRSSQVREDGRPHHRNGDRYKQERGRDF